MEKYNIKKYSIKDNNKPCYVSMIRGNIELMLISLLNIIKDDIEKKNPLLNPETFKIKIQNLSDYEQCYLTKDKKINDFWTQN